MTLHATPPRAIVLIAIDVLIPRVVAFAVTALAVLALARW